MELEFNCPYCTAAIRVDASAAGKLGHCPKCGIKLRVPELPDQPAAAPLAPTSAVPPLEVLSDELVPPVQSSSLPGTMPLPPVIPQPVGPAAAKSPVASRFKPRRRGTPAWAGLVPPILFGGLLLLVLALLWYWNLPNYTGTLTGEVVPANYSLSAVLHGQAAGAPPAEFRSWMGHLLQFPITLVDPQGAISVRYLSKDGQRLTVLLEPGPEMMLVRVPLHAHAAIKKYHVQQVARLEEARQQELASALKQICTDWKAAQETGGRLENLGQYMRELGFNTHVQGLGRICEAVANNGVYPCVAEDDAGHLTFLVPRGTARFQIRERPGSAFFPSPLKLDVTVTPPAAAPVPGEAEPVLPMQEIETAPLPEPEVSPDLQPFLDNANTAGQ